jgi:hypothetical protein
MMPFLTFIISKVKHSLTGTVMLVLALLMRKPWTIIVLILITVSSFMKAELMKIYLCSEGLHDTSHQANQEIS